MPQTKEQAARAKENRIRKIMEERGITYELAEVLYREEMRMYAKLGGKASKGGGFAYGELGRRRASIAGRRGGRASKRK